MSIHPNVTKEGMIDLAKSSKKIKEQLKLGKILEPAHDKKLAENFKIFSFF